MLVNHSSPCFLHNAYIHGYSLRYSFPFWVLSASRGALLTGESIMTDNSEIVEDKGFVGPNVPFLNLFFGTPPTAAAAPAAAAAAASPNQQVDAVDAVASSFLGASVENGSEASRAADAQVEVGSGATDAAFHNDLSAMKIDGELIEYRPGRNERSWHQNRHGCVPNV